MPLKKQTIILCFSFITLFISCKKEEHISIEANRIENIPKRIDYSVDFPDTVYVNQLNEGIVDYKSDLDSIITIFGNKEKNRHVRLFFGVSTNPDNDYNTAKTAIRDTFGALNNKQIPFYDIKFSKPGVYYMDGIINDYIVIDLHKKDREGYDTVRIVENEERISHKIIVLPASK